MKAIEQYFHVVLFIMLYNVALTFKSVGETLVSDHSNGYNFSFADEALVCDHSIKAFITHKIISPA